NNSNSEIIYGIEKSSIPNDPKIMGAFLGLQESTKPAGTNNPNLVMAVGNGVMWVVDKGEDIAAGDFLISSDVPGHAMKDNGTYSTAFVIAKVAEPVNWSNETATIYGVKHKLVSVFFESFIHNNAEKKLQTLQTEMNKLKEQIKLIEEKVNAIGK
ncbi:MAG TPA: hypothetical protein VER36_01280, partial [Flavisolibacter sp.]|nr:hypothetical protein [Flavisolibacter sp.]